MPGSSITIAPVHSTENAGHTPAVPLSSVSVEIDSSIVTATGSPLRVRLVK
jgi:hypothetical protein